MAATIDKDEKIQRSGLPRKLFKAPSVNHLCSLEAILHVEEFAVKHTTSSATPLPT